MSDADTARAHFVAALGREPQGVWAAPGRVNLIGEHTDYNEGFVLPFAIDRRCVAAASVAASSVATVRSVQRPEEVVTFDVETLSPGAIGGWAAYVAGVVWAFREAGHDVPAVDVVLDSTVPLGASLSSSAALECSIALALRDLAGLDLDATGLALLAQRAENDFVGMPCGVMDQMASMHGAEGDVVFLDTRTLDVENVPFDPARHGLTLLVVDTRAPHALVDGEYAARRRDCEEAARRLGVPFLRDVAPDDLDAALARLDDDRLRRRARHVVTEDARVLDLVRRMRGGGDPREVAHLLTESHASMRDDFEITVPHVDVAVEAALEAGALGARMTGGGFGGSVIVLAEATDDAQVLAAIRDAYADRGYDPPAPFEGLPAEGATRLA